MMCQNRDSKPSYKPTKIAVCLSKTKSKANAYQAKTILTVKTKFVMFFKKQLMKPRFNRLIWLWLVMSTNFSFSKSLSKLQV